MGEILRAVLDKSCTMKRPVFYTLEILRITAMGEPALNFVSDVIITKEDRWFLMTGYSLIVGATTIGQYMGPVIQSAITIKDPANNKAYNFNKTAAGPGTLGGEPTALINKNLNAWETLPEYILWGPHSTIQIEGLLQTRSLPAGNFQLVNYVTLVGIEYGE